MKYSLEIFCVVVLLCVGITAGTLSEYAQDRHEEITQPQETVKELKSSKFIPSIPEIETEVAEIIVSDPQKVFVASEVPLLRDTEFVNLTFEEQELLEQIAMAEARGEGTIGMALIMRVVLNRSLKTGQSIRQVIYAPNQFYTAGMCAGNDECHEALAIVMDGWDESQGAIYFCAGGYSKYGEPLMQVGNHYFSA